jgi:hypothetical protein
LLSTKHHIRLKLSPIFMKQIKKIKKIYEETSTVVVVLNSMISHVHSFFSVIHDVTQRKAVDAKKQ